MNIHEETLSRNLKQWLVEEIEILSDMCKKQKKFNLWREGAVENEPPATPRGMNVLLKKAS